MLIELLSKENDIFFDWSSGDGNLFLAGDFVGRFFVGFEAWKDCTATVTKYLVAFLRQNDKHNVVPPPKPLTFGAANDLSSEWDEPLKVLPSIDTL